jgi:peptidoglycan/LPS O-acetylase OafA/YrhL
MDKGKKLPALDFLRAMAILAVILFHMMGHRLLPPTNPVLGELIGSGSLGVDLFFVLSGYLIGGIVLSELRKTGRLDVGRFWYRRWMRTLPAYYVTLGLYLAVDYAVAPGRAWHHPLSYLVFLQNYANGSATLRFYWSWSLCVEEWFYVSLPLAAVLLLSRVGKAAPEKTLRVLALFAFFGSFFSRLLYYHLLGDDQAGTLLSEAAQTMYTRTHFRLDGLAAGLFLCTLPKPRGWLIPGLCCAAALGVLAAVIFVLRGLPPLLQYQHYTVVALVFGAAVYAGLADNAVTRYPVPGAEWIANLSYSLYLLHPFTLKAAVSLLPSAGYGPRLLLAVALTLGASIGMRHLVEMPFLRLRDRAGRRGGNTPAAPRVAPEGPGRPRPPEAPPCPDAGERPRSPVGPAERGAVK